MAKKKEAQAELGGMPEPDECGKAARAYLEARNAVEDAKEVQVAAGTELASLLRAKKRVQIKVDGVLITLRHVNEDVLKVSKPKEK